MLSLYSRVQVTLKNKDQNDAPYTFFGDSEDPELYYCLPDRPKYMAEKQIVKDNKKISIPAFSLFWYYGYGNKEDNATLTFTVALEQPDLRDANTKKFVAQQIQQDDAATALAYAKFNIAKAEKGTPANHELALKLSKELGLTDEQFDAICAKYDANVGHLAYLPTPTMTIQPVPYTSGKVTVRAFKNPDAYQSFTRSGDTSGQTYRADSAEVVPSQVGDNEAVISFNLNSMGATLFWNALGGPSLSGKVKEYDPDKYKASVIYVTYEVNFNAMLPAATATVTLTDEVITAIKTKTTTNTWGKERTQVESQSFEKTFKDATKITIPGPLEFTPKPGTSGSGPPAPKSATEVLRDYLQTWAKDELATMLQDQMPAVNFESVGPTDIKPDEVKRLHTDTRKIEFNQGIIWTAWPQAQLPSLKYLGDEILEDLFESADLHSKVFATKDLVVQPPNPNLCKKLSVSSVTMTNVTYSNKTCKRNNTTEDVGPIVFNEEAMKKPGITLGGEFDAKTESAEFEYDYTVEYSDGSEPYKVKGAGTSMGTTRNAAQDSSETVTWSAKDFGVIFVKFDAKGLPWGFVEKATVELRYNDEDLDEFTLTERNASMEVIKPLSAQVDKPLEYKVKFFFQDSDIDAITYPADGYAKYDGIQYDKKPLLTELSSSVRIPVVKLHKFFPYAMDGLTGYQFSLASDVEMAEIDLSYEVPYPPGQTRITQKIKGKINLQAPKRTDTWMVPRYKNAELHVEQASAYDAQKKMTQPGHNAVTAKKTIYIVRLDKIE